MTPKRPRDPNQLAKSIIDIATGQKPDRDPTPEEQGKRSVAVESGSRGGKLRAKLLSPQERQRIARKAAKARWELRCAGKERASIADGSTSPCSMPYMMTNGCIIGSRNRNLKARSCPRRTSIPIAGRALPRHPALASPQIAGNCFARTGNLARSSRGPSAAEPPFAVAARPWCLPPPVSPPIGPRSPRCDRYR